MCSKTFLYVAALDSTPLRPLLKDRISLSQAGMINCGEALDSYPAKGQHETVFLMHPG